MVLIEIVAEILQNRNGCMVSFVGAGGKTTTLFLLAQVFRQHCPVLVTTTTAMFCPCEKQIDQLTLGTEPPLLNKESGVYAWFSHPDDNAPNKVKGVSSHALDHIRQTTHALLILNEADGSKGKPIKAYASHEPVVPSMTDLVVILLGMDAMGGLINEQSVHRLSTFLEVTDAHANEKLTPLHLKRLLTHPLGLLSGLPPEAQVVLVLNKWSTQVEPFPLETFVKDLPVQIKCVMAADMASGQEIQVIRR